MNFNQLVAISISYVVLLFLVAYIAEKQAEKGRASWLRSPLVFTLSLSVYCTAWTFYGAVGYAARSGLEFLTIYIGPTIVMFAWWVMLRKLVRIGRTQRITSIADMISSRYGKSNFLGAMVTLLAVIGTTPYIALQLQSVTLSLEVFSSSTGQIHSADQVQRSALWIAAGLALFTGIFGTRRLDANERHHGVVLAIAVEAVVKLFALMAVGIFIVFFVADGPTDVLARIDQSPIADWQITPSRWIGLTFLAGAAFLCLPRMFQVLVVENPTERNLNVASWAFPLYLCLISLFVLPIAVMGLDILPEGSNPDLFVLTLPLALGQEKLAVLAFIGGFSSATSMVIVAAIALATMVSNNVVLPIWLSADRGPQVSGDIRRVVLLTRRLVIAGVLLLGYVYYRISGGGAALAAIGLISFAGVAQVLPAMLGGIFWRGATRNGALLGVSVGFVIWAYCLFLPSFGSEAFMSANLLANGPWNIVWLRPHALFGVDGFDPVIHAVFWSMLFNTMFFVVGSLSSVPGPLERLQAAQFVSVFRRSNFNQGTIQSDSVQAEDLLILAQRIIGPKEARILFDKEAERQGRSGLLPEPTPTFVERFERELAGSVGAATAHAMLGQIVEGNRVSVEDLMKVADEAAQLMEYSNQLEAKSAELEAALAQLRDANEKLTEISNQKDAFLSQISHELRTPMTSIRSFSEILMSENQATAAHEKNYLDIINTETIRMTRLLDDLLDLSVMESGKANLNVESVNLKELIDRALATSLGQDAERQIAVTRNAPAEDIILETDGDRLTQVLINLMTNANKYCDAENPKLAIEARQIGGNVEISLTDNGSGISKVDQKLMYDKFSRLSDRAGISGAGLGLAICKEIMSNLGGSISYKQVPNGARFTLKLPLRRSPERPAGRK